MCVGLDPDPELMAIADVAEFNARIVDATHDLVCAYKPNFPFYEALGIRGWSRWSAPSSTYARSRRGLRSSRTASGGTSARPTRCTRARCSTCGGSTPATVNAWGGGDSMEPYLEYADRGVFVWCRSSNPGAAEFQDVRVSFEGGSVPLFEWMAVKGR